MDKTNKYLLKEKKSKVHFSNILNNFFFNALALFDIF